MNRIIKRQVRQGEHFVKIVELYSLVASAAREEFTEDTQLILTQFLNSAHEEAIALLDNRIAYERIKERQTGTY